MTYAKLAKERDELKQEIERLNYEYDKAFERLKIQQQEIDRLRENERLKTKFVKDREVKAVKEFAEKLKEKLLNFIEDNEDYDGKVSSGTLHVDVIGIIGMNGEIISLGLIDKLLKEYEVEE